MVIIHNLEFRLIEMFPIGCKKTDKPFRAGFQSRLIPLSFFIKLDLSRGRIFEPEEADIVKKGFPDKSGYIAPGLESQVFSRVVNVVCGEQGGGSCKKMPKQGK